MIILSIKSVWGQKSLLTAMIVSFFPLLASLLATPACPPRIEAVWATAPRLGPPSPRTDSGAKIVPCVHTCRERDFRRLLCFARVLSFFILRTDYIIFPFLFLLFSHLVSSICWHPDLIPRILGLVSCLNHTTPMQLSTLAHGDIHLLIRSSLQPSAHPTPSIGCLCCREWCTGTHPHWPYFTTQPKINTALVGH